MDLEELGLAKNPGTLGSKAERLNELAKWGYAVPPGFVIQPHESIRSSENVAEIQIAVTRIGGFPVAVRSSSGSEDLPDQSFAGIYESYLNISSMVDLIEAVEKCREAAAAARVSAYMGKGLTSTANREAMPVLIQKMVDAKLSGVLFSIHPLEGKEEEGLLEVVSGLGERLVSGQVTPTRARLDLVNRKLLKQEVGADHISVSDVTAVALVELALSVQAAYGCPQDIEWAMDAGGKLWVLQTRPITRVAPRLTLTQWTNADFRDGGVSARICTPLMYSLYRSVMQESMPRYLRAVGLLPKTIAGLDASDTEWIQMFYGRPYWNVGAIKSCLADLPGYDEAAFDRDLGIQSMAKSPKVKPRIGWRESVRKGLHGLNVLLRLHGEFFRAERAAQAFQKRWTALETQQWAEWQKTSSMSDHGAEPVCRRDDKFYESLCRMVHQFYWPTEKLYFRIIYNNSNLQSLLKDLLQSSVGAESTVAILPILLGGLTDVCHMELQRDLMTALSVAKQHGLESAAWIQARKTFLNKNYFHSDAELDLTVARWGEAPERIDEMVGALLRSQTQPAQPKQTAQDPARVVEATLHDLARRLRNPIQRWCVLRTIRRARRFLSHREAVRELSSKSYALVRRYVLEAGRRLARSKEIDNAQEVFLLTIDELMQRKIPVCEELKWRRQIREGYRHFKIPNEMGLGVFMPSMEVQPNGRALQGIGCSMGEVEGRVRILRAMSEMDRLQSGDILVTRFTDPGWTPVLGLVAGVITEVGGMLSHAAVISREYGIPAVLSCDQATTLLPDGARVRMNGMTGTIEVLS